MNARLLNDNDQHHYLDNDQHHPYHKITDHTVSTSSSTNRSAYHNNSHHSLTHIPQSMPIRKNMTIITIDILIHVKDINDKMITLQYLYQLDMRSYSNNNRYTTPINSDDLNINNDYYTCSLNIDNKFSVDYHDKDEDDRNDNNNDGNDNDYIKIAGIDENDNKDDNDHDHMKIMMYGLIKDDVKLFCDRYYFSETVCSNVYTKVR